jgi:tripartite tricarboxylate transporter family receptor
MAGQVQAVVETVPGVVGQVQSWQLRALGVSSERRRPLFPDVPTVTESGITGYEVTSWNGLVVPARTPDAIVARLNAETAKAIAEPDMGKRLAELGLVPKTSTPQELQAVYEPTWSAGAASSSAPISRSSSEPEPFGRDRSISFRRRVNRRLVSRFRSSHHCAAPSFANFGIEGH